MSEPTPHESGQDFGISGDASLENVQIGGIAKRDLTSIQVQNLTVYDSIDVAGIFKPSSLVASTSLTRQEYRQRKVLLNKVKNFWIGGVLEKSLHTRVVIELGLEERPHAIQPPFSGVEEFTEETARPLPSGTSARMVLAEMDEGVRPVSV